MKRYYITVWTKRRVGGFGTNSIKLVNWIANLPFWKVVKVTDLGSKEVILYKKV